MADWDYRPEEERKEEKEKKYVTRKEFRICFVIMLVAIGFATLSINDSIRQSRNEISSDIYQVEQQISNTINSIPRNIEQGIAEANNPILKSRMEIVGVDEKAKTAAIRMTAVPKEYVDGMTMKFMVSCDDGEKMEVPAVAGADRVYTAERTVPFCDVVSATVHLQKNGTESICQMENVYINENVLPVFNGRWSGSIGWMTGQDFVTFDGEVLVDVNTPQWLMLKDKGNSFKLKNQRLEVYVDGKLHKTYPAIAHFQDEYNCEYRTDFTGENKIKLEEFKKIEFIFKAEDSNGLKYSYLTEKGTWTNKDGYDSDEYWAMTDTDKLTIE